MDPLFFGMLVASLLANIILGLTLLNHTQRQKTFSVRVKHRIVVGVTQACQRENHVMLHCYDGSTKIEADTHILEVY